MILVTLLLRTHLCFTATHNTKVGKDLFRQAQAVKDPRERCAQLAIEQWPTDRTRVRRAVRAVVKVRCTRDSECPIERELRFPIVRLEVVKDSVGPSGRGGLYVRGNLCYSAALGVMCSASGRLSETRTRSAGVLGKLLEVSASGFARQRRWEAGCVLRTEYQYSCRAKRLVLLFELLLCPSG